MISNSSDPTGSPTMRTVYLRATNETNVVIPPATEAPNAPLSGEGVLSLVSRLPETTPSATQLMAIDSPQWTDAQMSAFSWETAQAILADPMQAMRSQRAPVAESVTALLDA